MTKEVRDWLRDPKGKVAGSKRRACVSMGQSGNWNVRLEEGPVVGYGFDDSLTTAELLALKDWCEVNAGKSPTI